jgi:GGDEF domain-containing protein
MTAATSPKTSEASQQRSQLSVSQMLAVMRVEFLRARTQKYAITCLMIAVDGLPEALELYGYEAKRDLMRATYDCLRRASRELGFIGMALMSGDRIMAVFPNSGPKQLSKLGDALCSAASQVEVPAGDGKIHFTLSLGASHNLLAETHEFEGFVEMAGRALSASREGGGDQYVMWREAEAEVANLREELEQATSGMQKRHAELVEQVSDYSGLEQAAIIDRIQQLFSQVQRTPEIEELEKQIVALAQKELFEERHKAIQAEVAEHQGQIDLLQRRISKLTKVLGMTEADLRKVMAMKNIDEGVASIYRTVQGLDDDGAMKEAKQAMMADIFEANLALQRKES